MDGCTERSRRKRNSLTTANPVYRCEELEDAMSIYDDIEENRPTHDDHTYVQVLGDETASCRHDINAQELNDSSMEAAEECDPQCKPQLPSRKALTESQDQNEHQGYEGLKEEIPDHIYLQVLSDETASCNQDINAQELNENSMEAADKGGPQCKPQLPSPEAVTESQDHNQQHGYEGLKEETPDHNLQVLDDETASCEQGIKAQDGDQDVKPEEHV